MLLERVARIFVVVVLGVLFISFVVALIYG